MVRGNQSLNSGLRVPADKRFLDIFRVYVLKMASIAVCQIWMLNAWN